MHCLMQQILLCLMRLVSENPDIKVVVVVSDKCKKALDFLLRQTQVMMDWWADPVLENGKWQQNTKIFFT